MIISENRFKFTDLLTELATEAVSRRIELKVLKKLISVEYTKAALAETNGNVAKASRILKMYRSTFNNNRGS